MKIEYIRKHRNKSIGEIEDVSNRVGHRFINHGLAKEVIKPKRKSKKKYEKQKF